MIKSAPLRLKDQRECSAQHCPEKLRPASTGESTQAFRGERTICSYRCGRLSTAVAIEIGPVCFQPFARTLHAAADLARQLPETRTVIHFPQVRDLVRDHVVHH